MRRIISSDSPEALALAKALGLDTVDLMRFIFDVEAGQPITVTAFYNKFVTVEAFTDVMIVTKRFKVVSDDA